MLTRTQDRSSQVILSGTGMTQRKQPQESFESFAERQIREAQERGELDDLPGAGKPSVWEGRPYHPDWWLADKLRREDLDALPESLRIRRERELALEAAARAPSEAAARRILEELNQRIRRLNATIVSGPPTTVAPVDIDAVLAGRRSPGG